MPSIVYLTPAFAVSRQLELADIEGVARLGFRTIVAVRPDGEERHAPSARRIGALARKRGLRFVHVPVAMHEVTDDAAVARFEHALSGVEGPALAYCKSGTRAAILWALAAARHQPLDGIAAALRRAGVAPDTIADELRARHDRPSSAAAPSTSQPLGTPSSSPLLTCGPTAAA